MDRPQIEDSSRRLSRMLRDKPWYHCIAISYINDKDVFFHGLAVYAEYPKGGTPPGGIPPEFEGWPVEVRQCSRANPCPFGSVKKDYNMQRATGAK